MRALVITCLACATAAADPPTTNTTITAPVSLAPPAPAPPADATPRPVVPRRPPGRVATVEFSAGGGAGLGYYDPAFRSGMPTSTTFAMQLGVSVGGFATQHFAILGRLVGATGPQALVFLIAPEAQLWIDDDYWIAAGVGRAGGGVGESACFTDQCNSYSLSGVGGELRVGYHIGPGRGPEVSATVLRLGVSGPVTPTIVTFQIGYQLL